jgi:hypothetical protein
MKRSESESTPDASASIQAAGPTSDQLERPPSPTPRTSTSTSASHNRSTLASPSSSTVDHHSVCMDQVVHRRLLPSATYPAPPFLQSLVDCRLETLPSSATHGGPGACYACTTTHPGPAAQPGGASDDFEFSDADDSSSESSDSELGNDDDADTTHWQQCSSTGTTDSDSAPDCPDDRDTMQTRNCRRDTDSGSEIDFNVQISADVQHAARGDSQHWQHSDASANVERSRFLSAERQCRLCKTGHEHPYHFFFECAAGRFPSLRDALLLDAPLQNWRILAAIRDAVLNFERRSLRDLRSR